MKVVTDGNRAQDGCRLSQTGMTCLCRACLGDGDGGMPFSLGTGTKTSGRLRKVSSRKISGKCLISG